MKRMTKIFICFLLTAVFITFPTGNGNAQLGPTRIPKGLNKRQKNEVIKIKTEAALEPAYLKAENKLADVKIGISLDEFFRLMGGFEIHNEQKQLVDVIINGHLMDASYKGQNDERIDEFVFGYVKNSLVIPKFKVKFIDFKLSEINRFKKDSLEDASYLDLSNIKSDDKIQIKEITENSYNVGRFHKAKERIKNVSVDMGIMEFVIMMEGHYSLVQIGKDPLLLMDGFLNLKGDYNFDIKDNVEYRSVWAFGYMENGAEIPKFFVLTDKRNVKDIIFEIDKERFENILKYKQQDSRQSGLNNQ